MADLFGQLEAALRFHGLPVTAQRRIVLEAIAACRGEHPTADKVLARARALHPDVSRATVYRTLERLAELDVLRIVCHPGPAVRYDPDLGRHHHLVCRACRKIVDLRAPELDHVPLPAGIPQGFAISDYSIEFQGLCRECRRRRQRGASHTKHSRRG